MNIEKIIRTPIPAKTILKKLDYKCNYVTYTEIKSYDDIEDLLGEHRKCLILILLQSPTLGHFVCILENDLGEIIFFDPYGYVPDYHLKNVPDEYKHQFNSEYKYLTELLLNSPKNIHYNQYKLQSKNTAIATCGYWCGVRLFYDDMTVDEFNDVFKGVKDKDKYVVKIFFNM